MNYSSPYQDWYRSVNQIGFKHLEYLSVFYSKAFEWQTQFYKAKLKAGERVGELLEEVKDNGCTTLTMYDIYHGYHAFYQKELQALYQTQSYKSTSQNLRDVLPIMTKLQKDQIENLFFPLPVKMLLHFQYPYFSPAKKLNPMISSAAKNDDLKNESYKKAEAAEKKKRKE